MILSEQAQIVANNLKEFDIEDFEEWYFQVHKIKIIGSTELIAYLEMKEKGIWKNKKMVIPNGR